MNEQLKRNQIEYFHANGMGKIMRFSDHIDCPGCAQAAANAYLNAVIYGDDMEDQEHRELLIADFEHYLEKSGFSMTVTKYSLGINGQRTLSRWRRRNITPEELKQFVEDSYKSWAPKGIARMYTLDWVISVYEKENENES